MSYRHVQGESHPTLSTWKLFQTQRPSESQVADWFGSQGVEALCIITGTHLILRAHEQEKVVVLDAAVRSWPPIKPICLRWEFPVFNPAPELDPTALRPERPRRKPKEPTGDEKESKKEVAPWNVETFVANCVTDQGRVRDVLLEVAGQHGVSKARAKALLQMAEAEGKVHRWVSGASKPVRLASVPQPLIEVSVREDSK